MNELVELLQRAGNRPAKGNRWICVDCPAGKSPALSVGDEVYFCHRCGTGGNVVTLKKALGMFEKQEWTRYERQNYLIRKAITRKRADEFLTNFRAFRLQKIESFRRAYDAELLACDAGRGALVRGENVSDEILFAAYEGSVEKDRLSGELATLDDPLQLRNFVDIYRTKKTA